MDKPYTIQQMANLTGVKTVTLRAWERRYGLLNPERSDGRYRMYDQQDVDTILRVTALMSQGVSIKQAAEQVMHEPVASEQAGSRWAGYIDNMMSAIKRLDGAALDDAMQAALAEHPLSTVLSQVITPLLREQGVRWANGEGFVAEEHFFSVYLRNQLGAQFHHLRPRPGARRLLAACLPGELHENGLLIFGLAAQAHGYEVVMLGANMPLQELPIAARKAGACATVLSGMLDASVDEHLNELSELSRHSDVPVFLGGNVSTARMKEVLSTGIEPLGLDLQHALSAIDNRLNHLNN